MRPNFFLERHVISEGGVAPEEKNLVLACKQGLAGINRLGKSHGPGYFGRGAEIDVPNPNPDQNDDHRHRRNRHSQRALPESRLDDRSLPFIDWDLDPM